MDKIDVVSGKNWVISSKNAQRCIMNALAGGTKLKRLNLKEDLVCLRRFGRNRKKMVFD